MSIGSGNILERISATAEGGPVVTVGFGADNPHNDLVSCMEYNLTSVADNTIHYDVILEPSDVLAFQLTHVIPHGSSTKRFADPISFPKTMYLDRFLFDKFLLVTNKRNIEQKMRQEIQELTRQRVALTRFNVCSFGYKVYSRLTSLGSRHLVRSALHNPLLRMCGRQGR